MCHLFLLLPVITLPIFWMVPFTLALAIYIPIVAVSLWLYWYVMKAMDRPIVAGREELLRANGRVEHARGRTLEVRVHSELWSAVSSDRLKRGDAVEVTGVDGLKLRVRRADRAAAGPPLASGHSH
jgi:membrane protein implicated in regulation of membrane protease activity